MFLIVSPVFIKRHTPLLSSENLKDIISGHAEMFIEHVIHFHPVRSGHCTKFRESGHLSSEAFLLRQDPAELGKILY